MLDPCGMHEEESHSDEHVEVDVSEMMTGSYDSSFTLSTSASDKKDGVSALGIHINLSNLIQVLNPSDRATVTTDRSLMQ